MIFGTWAEALKHYGQIKGRALIRCIVPGKRYLVADGNIMDSWIYVPGKI